MPHRAALAAQRGCDVLLNIANAEPVQVPGKIYEYLGAGRPIVHLRGDSPDVTSALVNEMGAGRELGPDVAALTALLGELSRMKVSGDGQLQKPFAGHAGIEAHSWRSIAADWQFVARRLLGEQPSDMVPATHASSMVTRGGGDGG